jgi:hypothetical protein
VTPLATAPTTTVGAAPALDLDARLTLVDVLMSGRLEAAALEADVRAAAHGAGEPRDLVLVDLPPRLVPCPYGPVLARTLWAAARHIEQHGHARGVLRDEQGATCALGALRAVSGGDCGHEVDAASLLLDTIRRRLGDRFETVPAWNDHPATDAHAVVRFLDEAAYRAS